jgi:hypothetical protein
VLTYRATSGAPVESVWSLMARPERWREWAPHVRGAWGLGEPEVIAGRRGDGPPARIARPTAPPL